MDTQQFINLLIASAGTLGGWYLRVMWQSIKDLQSIDKELGEKVANIEVLVAGQYVKREDMERNLDALFKKLDRIEDRLIQKVDK